MIREAEQIEMLPEMCHCGAPLHYSNHELMAEVEKIIADAGEYVKIRVGQRTWRVQRHYIFLHGLKVQDLPFLGFEEVV